MYVQHLIISNGLPVSLILNNVSIQKYESENIYKNKIFQARKCAPHPDYSKIDQATVTNIHLVRFCFFIFYTADTT